MKGLAQYDRMVVPGHEAHIIWDQARWRMDCSCGALEDNIAYHADALAAKRRHLRAMLKKQGGKD